MSGQGHANMTTAFSALPTSQGSGQRARWPISKLPRSLNRAGASWLELAILEGSFALEDVKTAAPRIISACWRGRDTYRCESMDAFVFDGRKGTLHNLIEW